MGKIFNAIDKQIIKPRVNAAEKEGFRQADQNMHEFHSQGNPVQYKWTHTIEETVRSTGVSGGNGNYSYEISLENPLYSTGTPNFPVLEEAQHNGSGILGKPNTWNNSVEDIQRAIHDNFSN